jgi:hypothetical protein
LLPSFAIVIPFSVLPLISFSRIMADSVESCFPVFSFLEVFLGEPEYCQYATSVCLDQDTRWKSGTSFLHLSPPSTSAFLSPLLVSLCRSVFTQSFSKRHPFIPGFSPKYSGDTREYLAIFFPSTASTCTLAGRPPTSQAADPDFLFPVGLARPPLKTPTLTKSTYPTSNS